jgi:hypothetical protein
VTPAIQCLPVYSTVLVKYKFFPIESLDASDSVLRHLVGKARIFQYPYGGIGDTFRIHHPGD